MNDEVIANTIIDTAEISMGTDITDMDLLNIQSLCDNVISMVEYRKQLYEYLCTRMNSIAPNLTILVGELVGARLISHAGSLLNLAKQPASTIQILGAEKALFRALKTKSNTPKYGLIYHASLIGQASTKNKGKISRILAAKTALSVRVDALSDDTIKDSNGDMVTADTDTTIGYEGRAKVEARLRQLESGSSGNMTSLSSSNVTAKKIAKYDPIAAKISSTSTMYNTSNDIQMDIDSTPTKKSNGHDDDEDDKKSSKKKDKKDKKMKKEDDKKRKDIDDNDDDNEKSSKKKKRKVEEDDDAPSSSKKDKKSKKEEKVETPMKKEDESSAPSTDKKSSKKNKKDKKERKSM